MGGNLQYKNHEDEPHEIAGFKVQKCSNIGNFVQLNQIAIYESNS